MVDIDPTTHSHATHTDGDASACAVNTHTHTHTRARTFVHTCTPCSYIKAQDERAGGRAGVWQRKH